MKPSHILSLSFVIILSGFFCFYGLGEYSFGEGDQTTHTLVVQDMVHSGSYLTPTLPDKPYFNKPPLKMWIASVAVELFGESNLSYRLVDGLLGVGIAVLTYRLSLLLFGSELIGILAVLNLMGSRLFLFGHGSRVATQDSALIFFLMLNFTQIYYFLHNHFERKFDLAKKSLPLIGLYTGLAIMCKGLGAGIIVPIFLLSLFLVGNPIYIVKKYFLSLVILSILALLPITLYLGIQGDHLDSYLQALFLSEGLNRATVGYHFVKHNWYYFSVIFKHEMAIAVEMLIPGLFILAFGYLRKREMAKGYLLILSIVPVVFYQLMKSKLEWYILPAVPGMCILGAYCWNYFYKILRETRGIISIFSCLMLLYMSYGFATQIFGTATKILKSNNRFVLDKIAHELEDRPIKTSLGVYDIKKLARSDMFYLRMIDSTFSLDKIVTDPSRVPDLVKNDLVMSHFNRIQDLISVATPKGYQLLPVYGRRRKPAVAFWYGKEEDMPPSMSSWCHKFSFGYKNDLKNALEIGFGWLDVHEFKDGYKFRPTKGEFSTLLFEGDNLLGLFPLSFKITIAANKNGTAEDIDSVIVTVNDTKAIVIESPREKFIDYTGDLPAHSIQKGKNMISIRHIPYKDKPISLDSKLSFISGFEICPK